jgi:putative pyruvate formate lyase activating enzyme
MGLLNILDMVLVMPELSIKDSNRAFRPKYLSALRGGKLESKIKTGEKLLENCMLCPRQCAINRYNESGKFCKTKINAYVSSYFQHFGEETCLVGVRGSGTIFFTSCNLRCDFCQNWDISHSLNGSEIESIDLAQIMIDLQDRGCHNINFVTPSHNVVPILKGIYLAAQMGLNIPLVYNTSAYDSLESLELMNGIIDIYMPDFKFWNDNSALRYMNAKDYPLIVKRNLKVMYDQVGDLRVNDQNIALRGLMVRHLVLPEHLSGTRKIAQFLAREISPRTALNMMFQYRPEYRVRGECYPELNRPLTLQEREKAREIKREAGLPDYPWL